MQWFRFYTEALDDPKVQRLPGDHFKAWVNLLCLANEQDERGILPDATDIAFRLRLSDDAATATIAALVRAGLLEVGGDGTLRIHAWDKRQYASDNSTDRVRKFREKQRETATKRERNKSETFRKRSSNAIDTEADIDPEERQSILRPAPPAGRGGGAAAPRNARPSPTPLRPAPKPKDAPPLERPRDLLFEAVCDACLIDWHRLTDTERGKVNAAANQIRKAGGTPDDVPTHAANYRQHFTTTLTPMALAGNWSLTASAPPGVPTRPPRGGGRATVEEKNLQLQRMYEAQENGHEPEPFPEAIDVDWHRHEQGAEPRPLRPVVAEVRRAPR